MAQKRRKQNHEVRQQQNQVHKISVSQAGIAGPTRSTIFKSLLFLGIVSAVVYGNSLASPFIWDDRYLVKENHFIRSFRYIADSFQHQLYYSTGGLSNFYRPLQTMSLMVDFFIWKENPAGYHLTNIILHTLTAFSIFLLLDALFMQRAVALMVGLLFLVHPVNSTVVNYISSRADSQATLCVVISLFFFVRSLRSQRVGFDYGAALVAFSCALLSKELATICPILMLLIVPQLELSTRRRAFKRTIPFFALVGVYGVARLTILNFVTDTREVGASVTTRFLTALEAIVRLIGEAFVPLDIHIEKDIPFSQGLSQASTFLSFVILSVIGAFLLWVWHRNPRAGFGFLWFFVAFIPMSGIVPMNATLADHWLYLPCMGLFLGVIALVNGVIDNRKSAKLRRVCALGSLGVYGGVIVLFSVLTVEQNRTWKFPVQLYESVLRSSPNSFRAHNELGIICMNQGIYDEAITHFKNAVTVNPHFDQGYDNLGVAYGKKGKYPEAIASHEKAIGLNRYSPKNYNNLGSIFIEVGEFGQAMATLRRALALNRDFKAAHYNVGVVEFRMGKYREAREAWRKVLIIDPSFQAARDAMKELDSIEMSR